ncbi:MAG: hypothetical protein ABI596_02920 [Pyrinomonadaceae bacterium]
MRRLTRALITFVLISVVFPGGSFISHKDAAAQRPIAKPIAPQRPRLVLLIVIDQFRYDYLERFGDLFGSRGIVGESFRPGRYAQTALPADVAPTLAAVLGIKTPEISSGRVLIESLKRKGER